MQQNTLKKELGFYGIALVLAVLPFNVFVSPAIVLFLAATLISCWNTETLARWGQNKALLYFVIPYFIYVLGLLYTSNMSQGWKELEYKLSLIFIPIAIASMPKFKNSKLVVLGYIYIGATMISTLYCLVMATVANGFSSIPTYSELSLHHHPTYLSLYVNVAILFASYLYRERKSKVLMVMLIVFYVFMNLLLNSKIGILFSGGFVLYFAVIHLFKKRSFKLATALFLIITLCFIIKLMPQVSGRFKNLMEVDFTEQVDPKSTESSALRILIWSQAIEILKEQPLLGVGTGDTKDALMQKYKVNGIEHAFEDKLNSHNQFFEWLVSFGIIGGIIFLLCFGRILMLSFSIKNNLYLILALLVILYMLVEAVFEKQSGIVFIVFLHSFLFFQPYISSETKERDHD